MNNIFYCVKEQKKTGKRLDSAETVWPFAVYWKFEYGLDRGSVFLVLMQKKNFEIWLFWKIVARKEF